MVPFFLCLDMSPTDTRTIKPRLATVRPTSDGNGRRTRNHMRNARRVESPTSVRPAGVGLVWCAFILAIVGCGSVTSSEPFDSGRVESGADVTAWDTGAATETPLDVYPDVDRDANGSDGSLDAMDGGQLKPCVHQSGPLSYSVPCSSTCAVSCRDQLAHNQIDCISQEGTVCVTTCQECP